MTAMWIWALANGASASEVDATVVRALSSRDGVSCAAVEALTATPRETLEQVVDTVSAPPWVPMRAAQCLIEGHAAEIQPRLEAWVVDPALKGLGRLVLAEIDQLPATIAIPVAKKALAGPDAVVAAARLRESASAEIRALVTP